LVTDPEFGMKSCFIEAVGQQSSLALALFCLSFSLKGELPGFKLGSGAGTGDVPVLHQALCCTSATPWVEAEDTEVLKRKRVTFGTHLRPPQMVTR